MSFSPTPTTEQKWQSLRLRLCLAYLLVAISLLTISGIGQQRVITQIGAVFGGFIWALDTDGHSVLIATPLQPAFPASSLLNKQSIVATNNVKGARGLSQAYAHTHPGNTIHYTLATNTTPSTSVASPAVVFTWDMWWQFYGMSLLAGVVWLLAGGLVLATSSDWTGAVESVAFLPPSLLLLLSCYLGNIQHADPVSPLFQLVWIPSFAFLGAALIHLSLTYHYNLLFATRPARWQQLLPYVPLLALLLYALTAFLISGSVPIQMHLLLSLGYAGLGIVVSAGLALWSVLRSAPRQKDTDKTLSTPLLGRTRRYSRELLILWIGGIILGFFLGILPLALTGQALLPLPMLLTFAAAYAFILLYATRTQRSLNRVYLSLEEHEAKLYESSKKTEEVNHKNRELEEATSLLLRADAQLRATISQRIHDQAKQQALRIRSLLAHWQHKLRVEAEQNAHGNVAAQPIIEALSKVRKISEELERDLRGLQLTLEDAYQRRSLGLKLHLQKLIREDLPALYPESPLKVHADLWALDTLSPNLEQTEEGTKIAEALSYTITQALLNIYQHAWAKFATVRTVCTSTTLDVYIIDDGRGFDPGTIPPEKTSLFKAQLKAREAGGNIAIKSVPRSQDDHGTTIILHLPLPQEQSETHARPISEEPTRKTPNVW